jgi:hypothetical protein
MPIEIREIVTEVVVRGPDEPATGAGASGVVTLSEEDAHARSEALVRQAVERVLDILRREWER